MLGDITRVTLQVTEALDQIGISYAVGGSMASSIHGVMRSTLDVDIVADIQIGHIDSIINAFSKDFYVEKDMIKDAIERHASFNLIHYETAFKVDVFVRKLRAFDQMQLDRRKPTVILSDPVKSVFVISPEDIILSKLEWFRLGGEVSDRQWRDIIGVLKTRVGELDLDYLHTWSASLKVEDLLERALKEME